MIEQINALSITWWSWMSGMFWQASLLIILISGIDLLLRRWVWPQVRYALWFMVLIKLLLPPTFASPVSITAGFRPIALKALGHYHTEQTSQTYAAIPVGTAITPAEGKPVLGGEERMVLTESESDIPKTKIKFNWQVFAMISWLLGSLAIFVFLIKKFSEMRNANESGEKKVVPDWFELLLIQCARKLNLQVVPNIVITKKVNSPAIFGMIKPVLLLPTDFFRETSKKNTENILLHELAHIKRRDLLVKELETFLTIIYWFNPLFWGVKKQLQHLRELCCDSTVANVLQKKVKGYRRTLLETARRLLAQPLEPGLGFLGLFEDSDRISARLKWLEKGTAKLRWLRNTSIVFILIFVPLFVLPMSKLELQKTMEDITDVEEELSEEIDKIGKLLAELDLLKDKLNDFSKEVEKINSKEIDSLEKILKQRKDGLDKRIEEHLQILKENEEQLREWNRKMKQWEEDHKNKSKEMLEKYGKIDKEDLEKIEELQKKYADKFKNKKWGNGELNNSIDSLLKSLDESSRESFSKLFTVLKPEIRFDPDVFPWDSFTVVKIGSDSILLPVIHPVPIHEIFVDSSQLKYPCSISIPKIYIPHKDSDHKACKYCFSRDYDIEKEGKLHIYNSNGKIEVITWNKKNVNVLAKVYTKSAKYNEETQFIEVKTGSPMVIRTKDLKDISVEYEIKVPQGTKVEKVLNSNGKVELIRVKGPTYLKSSNGKIIAKDIDGDVYAETSNGKIDIDKAGFVEARTSNGSIYLRNIKGIGGIRTSNGIIYAEIEKTKFDYTIVETSNANIELRFSKNLNAELKANTSMGRIYTHEISGRQRFEIINSKEEKYIKARLGKGGRQEIDVKTSNANVYIKAL